MLIDAHVEDENAECIDVFFACARETAKLRVLKCGEVLLPLRLLSKEQQLIERGETRRRSTGVRIHIPGSARMGTLRHIVVDITGAIPLRAVCRRLTLSHVHRFRRCVAYPLADVYTDKDTHTPAYPMPCLTVPGSFVMEDVDEGDIAVFHRPLTFTHKRSGTQRVVVVLSDGSVVKETVGTGGIVSTAVPLTHALAIFRESRDMLRESIAVVQRRDGRYSLVSKLPLIIGGC
jgi:hypothetical protein